ncbi:hypothetical protein F2Q69_00036150 [Brassica cretica]|uniref:Uncharacterized protein n=2 Tax=Brassica cretica TaxID=69181 RepID=A0A8S9SJ44_BRACR|nr:hypothetical protein F2Q69_00036150 [Brassica cretica]
MAASAAKRSFVALLASSCWAKRTMTACSISVTFSVTATGVEATEGCPPSVGVLSGLILSSFPVLMGQSLLFDGPCGGMSNSSPTILNSMGFVRIEGFEHLELGHEQYFVRGKPELMIKLCRKVASARIKKDIKAAKEAEKNGSVGDQPPIRKMCLKDAQGFSVLINTPLFRRQSGNASSVSPSVPYRKVVLLKLYDQFDIAKETFEVWWQLGHQDSNRHEEEHTSMGASWGSNSIYLDLSVLGVPNTDSRKPHGQPTSPASVNPHLIPSYVPRGAAAPICFKTGLAHLEQNQLPYALSCFDEVFLALATRSIT